MKRIRILQSVGSLGIGGNELFAMNLFRNINRDKFQVDFVVYDEERLEFYNEIIDAGSKVYFCKGKKKNKLFRVCEEANRVSKILKTEHYDILHCHSCSFAGILRAAIPGALANGIKVISHSHNPGMPKNNFYDNIVRYILRIFISNMVDYGFSCSDVAGKSKYTDTFMKSSKYFVINNAISIDNYKFDLKKRLGIRKNLGISEDEFVIGHVGRFENQKNHEFIIEIFEKLINKKSRVKLLLIGDGSRMEIIKAMVNRKRISESVLFMGHQTSSEIYYQAMDCFLLPSHYEGFPFVLVESQINGIRCIVSDTISNTVNISGGVEFVSLNNSAEKWADKILKFGMERMGAEQIEIVCDLYDLKKESRRIENLYMNLIGKSGERI